mgnify:CR=1 FL=1
MSDTENDGFLANIYDFCPFFGKYRSLISVDYLSELDGIEKNVILELGTATGLLTIPLLESGFYVDTVDYSGDMYRIAKNKVNSLSNQFSKKVNFILADITKIKLCKNMYGAVVIPDNLLSVISDACLTNVLQMCYDSLVEGGKVLLDICKPDDMSKGKKYSDTIRFRDSNRSIYIVRAEHEIDFDKQNHIIFFDYKRRINKSEYVEAESFTLVYHYRYVEAVVSILTNVGFSHIKVKENSDNIYFISAQKNKIK